MSTEFTKTVKLRRGQRQDEFIRSINWLLCNILDETAVAITLKETGELIPILRTTATQGMHITTYAAPVTKQMLHFNHLDYYTIPPIPPKLTLPSWLSFKVGLFAGRLYFDYTEYTHLQEQLHVEPEVTKCGNHIGGHSLAEMTFLQEWLALRRRGQDISHTPMGYVCQKRMLHADHPFFAAQLAEKAEHVPHYSGYTTGDRKENEYYDSDEDEAGLFDTREDDHFEE